MSHSIKVSDEVFDELKVLMGAQETYSHVIKRLLAIVKPIKEVSDILGPSHFLMEKPKQEVK